MQVKRRRIVHSINVNQPQPKLEAGQPETWNDIFELK
jgi:hypothetical protein